ncbi:MAG: hypothetical protein ONB44_04575 [candidate division KSB1 bacterium]|nr:hypothetical protein [candidate division KSB1 bacterium]MDZ7301398.1 hypothetical protein [candidate division KSB1 bacterium]MDZ7310717.1 hypothetical protein [candidate division KSB1 bacterium]
MTRRGKLFHRVVAASLLVGSLDGIEALFAQQHASENQRALFDSSAVSWSQSATYEIDRLRLLRWLNAHQDTTAVDFFAQVQELQHEAEAFAKQQDYVTAQLILDTALELTGLHGAPIGADAESGSVAAVPVTGSESSPALQWRREVVVGVDLWRQEFELGFTEEESLFVDRDGNPFVGLRISLNHDPALQPLPLISNISKSSVVQESRALNLAAYAMLKSSRDYYSGELEFNGRQSLGGRAFWRIQNRLEGTRYRRDFNLQYWQNLTSVTASADVGKNLRFEVADEFRLRRYREQTEFYPNYIQNQASFGAIFSSGYTTRLDSRYNYVVRAHASCPADDYMEHRIDASVSQSTMANSSILLENIWRNRIYPNNVGSSACRRTYQSTYQEEYARADLRLGLSQALALRVEGDFTLRQHKVPSDSTPDFLSTTVNPQFQFRLFSDLQVSLGYLYLLRVYEKDIIQVDPSTSISETSYPFYEDYYSHGFTVGIDLLRTDGLLFSVNEIFEARTYPNATAQNIPGFGLYTDRNINSLLLFFSWNFLPKWQASMLANFDDDRSRTENRSDSRNTLFSIDLSYSF